MISEERRADLRARFAKLASNHAHWLMTAQRLYRAAQVISVDVQRRWDDQDFRKPPELQFQINDGFQVTDIQPSYMMLMGFALENLFKARLVQLRSTELRQQILSTGRLPKVLLTHDLGELTSACSLELSESDRNALNRLVKFSVWRGRYHFPLTFEVFYHLRDDSEIFSSGIGFASSDVRDFTLLTQSLSKALGLNIECQSAG